MSRAAVLLCVFSAPLGVLRASADPAIDKRINEGLDKIEAKGSYAFQIAWRARNAKGEDQAERTLTGEYLRPDLFQARIKNMEMIRYKDKGVINNGSGKWVPAGEAKPQADSAGRTFYTANAPRILRELQPPHVSLRKLPGIADKLRRGPRSEKVKPGDTLCFDYEGSLKTETGDEVIRLFKDMQSFLGNWAKLSALKEGTVRIYFGQSDNQLHQVLFAPKVNHGAFGKKDNPWTVEEEITILTVGDVPYQPAEEARKILGLPDKDEWELQQKEAAKAGEKPK